jgi:trimeric autotransporter adhesin
MHPLIQLKKATPLFLIVLVGFGFLPVQAVVPPPDGGYPGFNTAEGQNALFSLTTATGNVAVGWASLYSDAEGNFNTAIGTGALLFNTADQNTATGAGALLRNTIGLNNTANGAFALSGNVIGSFNTAVGSNALSNNPIGRGNIALGNDAGANVTTANNVTCIGAAGANLDNTCYIGRIFGVGVSGGSVAVFVDSDGKLATNVSSRRFEQDIEPMDKASESILALRPVTFHYKTDTKGTPQFGLVAEEVAAVNPDLVVRDKNDEIYSVRYEAVNAMLLNEFLKEHRKVEQQGYKIQEQDATIAQLKKDFGSTVAQQEKQIEALTAGLQKVSAQLEASKPAPQVVNNP